MKNNEILVIYGQNMAEMAATLARKANLAALIGERKSRIGIKPNLVLDAPASDGATTHAEVAEGLIDYLQGEGFGDITILEGAWVGAKTARAFDLCGYSNLAARKGVKLVDTQKDRYIKRNSDGLELEISQTAAGLDFLISLPVMKGHCQTGITCALKNAKGLISNAEKRRFHALGLHRPIAALNATLPTHFVMVDAICGDLDFEEGGNPVVSNRMFAARDPVLCDAFVAREMGYALAEVPYIGMAAALGVGSSDLENAIIREINAGQEGGAAPAPTGKARRLAAYVQEDGACSACYAALVRGLSRLTEGERRALDGKVCIGQGYRGKSGRLGVGTCTVEFAQCAPGCPPNATDVVAMLKNARNSK